MHIYGVRRTFITKIIFVRGGRSHSKYQNKIMCRLLIAAVVVNLSISSDDIEYIVHYYYCYANIDQRFNLFSGKKKKYKTIQHTTDYQQENEKSVDNRRCSHFLNVILRPNCFNYYYYFYNIFYVIINRKTLAREICGTSCPTQQPKHISTTSFVVWYAILILHIIIIEVKTRASPPQGNKRLCGTARR